MKLQILILLAIGFALYQCQEPTHSHEGAMSERIDQLDIQGHRGCRGLMPENAIPGFIKALELGVTTLEMDAVITSDEKVILSHEPFFSPDICMDSTGLPITDDSAFDNNIYHMTYDQVRQFDCGTKVVESFPDQEKLRVHKPLLAEVIDTVEAYVQEHSIAPVGYNIEIKSSLKGDSLYHPVPEKFAALLLSVIQDRGVGERVIIQSFDPRALRAVHKQNSEIRTALLIGSSSDYEKNIDNLGFVPTIYSPNWRLASADMVKKMHENNIKVIPWTVNEQEDMKHLIDLGVDGIITDYPDRLIDLVNSLHDGDE